MKGNVQFYLFMREVMESAIHGLRASRDVQVAKLLQFYNVPKQMSPGSVALQL